MVLDYDSAFRDGGSAVPRRSGRPPARPSRRAPSASPSDRVRVDVRRARAAADPRGSGRSPECVHDYDQQANLDKLAWLRIPASLPTTGMVRRPDVKWVSTRPRAQVRIPQFLSVHSSEHGDERARSLLSAADHIAKCIDTQCWFGRRPFSTSRQGVNDDPPLDAQALGSCMRIRGDEELVKRSRLRARQLLLRSVHELSSTARRTTDLYAKGPLQRSGRTLARHPRLLGRGRPRCASFLEWRRNLPRGDQIMSLVGGHPRDGLAPLGADRTSPGPLKSTTCVRRARRRLDGLSGLGRRELGEDVR